MNTLGRLCTSVLLVLVLAALAVPAGIHFGPSLIAALQAGMPDGDSPAPPAVPAAQQVPGELQPMTAVLELSAAAPIPDSQVLTAALDNRLSARDQGGFTGVVLDALTGEVLYDDGGDQARVPASNLKLLTAVTALDALGADHRFQTTVVRGQDPGTVVLVGGGDVLLANGESDPDAVMGHAGLATLAAETVAALQAQPEQIVEPISVKVDDSLFGGRVISPGWFAGDLTAGQVAPVYPLALNSGRFAPEDRYGQRPQDAAMHTADTFADALRAAGKQAGITVNADVSRVAAESAATEDTAAAVELAAVQSATVAEQIKLALETSDNYLTEALGRMAAVGSGREGSFDGATETTMTTIAELGVDTIGMVLVDSSGLSSANRISAAQLAQLLSVIVNTEDADLHAVLDALPVAGLTGTLDDRFTREPALDGAGLVRAKTGTLNEVISLSGHLVTAEGRLLTFSFIGNELGSIDPANERALDESTAILARCGCRS